VGGAALLSTTLASRALSNMLADERPNIVLMVADDHSWPHAGIYGNKTVPTPNIDKMAAAGITFNNCFCNVSSCAPSRASLLSGRAMWALGTATYHHGEDPAKKGEYAGDLLAYPYEFEKHGYAIGRGGKGYNGPFDTTVFRDNPAGPGVSLSSLAEGTKPFVYWQGSKASHRPYPTDVDPGIDLQTIDVPPFYPDDSTEICKDLAMYFKTIREFDRQLGDVMATLESKGKLNNTLIIVTSDNGLPFPRCKANCYEYSLHMPMIVRWDGKISGGRTVDDFICFEDFAPTFFEAAGIQIPVSIQGRSFLDILLSGKNGQVDTTRTSICAGKEVHNYEYPIRAIRTKDSLYIRNFSPEAAVQYPHDIQGSPTSKAIIAQKDGGYKAYYDLCFGKRPAEELFDIAKDPYTINNVADDPSYAAAKENCRCRLQHYMHETDDFRATGPCASVNAILPADRIATKQVFSTVVDTRNKSVKITLADAVSQADVSITTPTGKRVAGFRMTSRTITWKFGPTSNGFYILTANASGIQSTRRICLYRMSK
jgi:uncharacterized sulfatase